MCNKFEEFGLLYVSGELSTAEAREYEAHVAVCEECRRETEAYRKERAELYTADILSERPSPAVDAEILRLSATVRKAPTAFSLMLFLKKYAPVPVFIMLVAVAVGGYFRYHAITSDNLVAKYANEPLPLSKNDNIQAPAPVSDEELVMSDSGKPSHPDTNSNAPFSKTRGNMNLEGVVTVKGAGDR